MIQCRVVGIRFQDGKKVQVVGRAQTLEEAIRIAKERGIEVTSATAIEESEVAVAAEAGIAPESGRRWRALVLTGQLAFVALSISALLFATGAFRNSAKVDDASPERHGLKATTAAEGGRTSVQADEASATRERDRSENVAELRTLFEKAAAMRSERQQREEAEARENAARQARQLEEQVRQQQALDRSREATEAYWAGLSRAIGSVVNAPSPKDEAAAARALNRIAASIGALDTLDVDEVAYRLGSNYAKTLRSMAGNIEYLGSNQFLLDSMQHGANGDPLWSIGRRKELVDGLTTQKDSIAESVADARRELAHRYGVEFRNLPRL